MTFALRSPRLDPLAGSACRWCLRRRAPCSSAVPIRVFGLQLPEPVFALAPAFAWAVIRPSMLAPFLLLALGLFLDLFWGGPAGLWALALLVAYGMVLAVRATLTGRARRCCGSGTGGLPLSPSASGLLITLIEPAPPGPCSPLFWQFLVTVLLYPFAHRLIERFEDADVRFR